VSRLLDPVYRLSHLYQFKPKSGGLATFNPNKFQRQRYNRVYPKIAGKEPHKEIELKSRKVGTTTGCCFFCLDNVAYRKYIEAVTIAHTAPKATEYFNNIVKFSWDRIPKGLKPGEKYNTKAELDLSGSTGGKYIVSTDIKGTTPDIEHIAEAAYFQNDERILEALAALPPHGICIVESTAHGMGNWFEQAFNEAWAAKQAGKDHEWLPIFNPWYADPYNRVQNTKGMSLKYEAEAKDLQERFKLADEQIYWWDRRKQEHRDLVYQFYPSTPEEAFIHSGRPVFNLETKYMLLMERKHTD